MKSHGFDWDRHPEVVSELIRLWNDEKLSANNIAKTLGHELTRCSIIGKVHRLGLPSHGHPSRHSKPRPPKPPKVKVVEPPIECPSPACPPETFPDGKVCKHITGDPSEPGWQMCANPVKPERHYCEYHYSKVIDLVRTAQVRAQRQRHK